MQTTASLVVIAAVAAVAVTASRATVAKPNAKPTPQRALNLLMSLTSSVVRVIHSSSSR